MTKDIQLDIAKGIEGWMSNVELDFLARIVQGKETIIEVGCHYGRSTRAMADNTEGIIYAIDPWSGDYLREDGSVVFTSGDHIYKRFLKNMKGLDNVMICRGKMEDFISSLPLADFIFLDGDHRYEEVLKDIELARLFVKRGGIIAGHDYVQPKEWPGVKKAVDECFGRIQQIDSIWFKEIV